MNPFFIIRMEYTTSEAPAIHISWPVCDLVDVTGMVFSPSTRNRALASLASPTWVEVACAFT